MSEDPKFTRGPWLLTGHTVYALQDVPAADRRRGWPEQENRVCFNIQAHRDVPDEEREATAFLMHAAEDLYDACDLALDALISNDTELNLRARAAIRGAMKKAEGRK